MIRGGGDLASGVAFRLMRCGIACLITELPDPLSVRRLVSYSSAIYSGQITIESLTAQFARNADEACDILSQQKLPVLIDPDLQLSKQMGPTVIVDGRMQKQHIHHAVDTHTPIIGLGPGYIAGKNCMAVIETNRGSKLGRVIRNGITEPDTGIPEKVFQYSTDRVLRAPDEGSLVTFVEIADLVEPQQPIAEVSGAPIRARFAGVIRGLLRNGSRVHSGMKIGDLDPRRIPELATQISDKALAVGGGVLEAILSDPILRNKLMCGNNETA